MVEVAERQWGVIHRSQLIAVGIPSSTINVWTAAGRLHRVLPNVYAVGHRRLGIEGKIKAALLYAGPGAVISHITAGWWWRIWGSEPKLVHVSTHRRSASVAWVKVHRRRNVGSVVQRGIEVTGVGQTLLDLAAVLSLQELRNAVAEAEHLELLIASEVERMLGRGRPGSRNLRIAIEAHFPQLAATRSVLEVRFLDLCRDGAIPLPEVNVRLEGFLVDALWREQRVVVELDGMRDHAKPAAIERDRARDLALRAAGWIVLRYTWHQLVNGPHRVLADLRSALALPTMAI